MLSEAENYPVPRQLNELYASSTIWKITALWAFSEAALGGILHAFRVPFRGVFIGGSAAILISLLAFFSKEKGVILRSTIIVIIIKGIASPYTPLTAYLAVFLQGILGEVLFFNKKFFKVSAFVLGILVLLFSSMQKIIVLTVLFGNTLWDSIDQYGKAIISEFIANKETLEINLSYIIVGMYLGLHIILGMLIGTFAGRFPFKIIKIIHHEKPEIDGFYSSFNNQVDPNKQKHKHWWQKPTGYLFIILILGLIILSYLYPKAGSNKTMEVLIMVFRAIGIMIIWYFLLAPLLFKFLRKYLKKKQNQYSAEISKIVDNFPHFRKLVYHCWKNSSNEKGYIKIKYFVTQLVTLLLLTDFNKL